MAERLQTIRARILYTPSQWWNEPTLIPDVARDEWCNREGNVAFFSEMAARSGDPRAIVRGWSAESLKVMKDQLAAIKAKASELLASQDFVGPWHPVHGHGGRSDADDWRMPSDFWRKVKQLSFAFDEDDWGQIRGFYREYGSLGAPPWAVGGDVAEGWGWCRGVLGWFREITNVVSELKEGQTERLEDRFTRKKWYETGWAQDHLEDSNYRLSPPWLERLTIRHGKWHEEWRPSAGHGLYSRMWEEVADSVGKELGKIPLAPIVSDKGSIQFGFRPEGAFHAAFLQWYFKELANVHNPVCRVCGEPLQGKQTVYCGGRCKSMGKQKDYRDRLEDLKRSAPRSR